MTLGEQIIYRVRERSMLRTAILTFNDEGERAMSNIKAFVAKVGGEQAYDDGHQCRGVKFPKGITPELWRTKESVSGMWVPRLNTKAGKALQEEMDKLLIPDARRFTSLVHLGAGGIMHGPAQRLGGFRVRHSYFVMIAGVYYVIVPIVPGEFTERPIVEGGARIRESDYVRLLEDAGAAPYDSPGALPQ